MVASPRSIIYDLRLYSSRWATARRILLRLFGISVTVGILLIAAAVAVLFALRWDNWVGARVDQATDDAYVKGDLTPLSAIREWVRRRGASPPMRMTASWSGRYGPTEYKVVAAMIPHPMAKLPL